MSLEPTKTCATCGLSDLSAPGPWRRHDGRNFCGSTWGYGEPTDCLAEWQAGHGEITTGELFRRYDVIRTDRATLARANY